MKVKLCDISFCFGTVNCSLTVVEYILDNLSSWDIVQFLHLYLGFCSLLIPSSKVHYPWMMVVLICSFYLILGNFNIKVDICCHTIEGHEYELELV